MSLDPPDPKANLAGLCETPVFQPLLENAEMRGLLSLDGVCQGGEAFISAVLAQIHPRRPVVVVCPNVQTQEQVHQELETWMPRLAKLSAKAAVPQFFPAWDVLPHESRLPHADVLSERLETLIPWPSVRSPRVPPR